MFSFGLQSVARYQGCVISDLVLDTHPPLELTSQCSLHNAPIFRLLLNVAVNGTHQCESLFFAGRSVPISIFSLTSLLWMCNPGQMQRTHVVRFELRSLMFSMPCLTVLAQDLCYSDPLSLVLTFPKGVSLDGSNSGKKESHSVNPSAFAVLRALRRGSGPWALDSDAPRSDHRHGPWALDLATVTHFWVWTGTLGPGFGVLRAPCRDLDPGPWIWRQLHTFGTFSERIGSDRIGSDRIGSDRIGSDWIGSDRIRSDPIRSDPIRSGAESIVKIQ